MRKEVRYANRSSYPRNEVAYATIPFKKGEWHGQALAADGASEYYLSPFGSPYDDGSYRFGALLARVHVKEHDDHVLVLSDEDQPESPSPFELGGNILQLLNASFVVGFNVGARLYHTEFSNWKLLETNPLRQVYQTRSRVKHTHFVVDLKFYVCSKQNIIKWELRVTGSDPDTTDKIYPVDRITIGVGETAYLHARNIERYGGRAVTPYRMYILAEDTHFGDGQSLSFYGELVPPFDWNDPTQAANALAAVEYPLHGMSQDWPECEEAYGPFGKMAQPLPDRVGDVYEEVERNVIKWWKFMSGTGNTWDNWEKGLGTYPGATGSQDDFGLIEAEDLLFSGLGELIDPYYFLAQEDAKRPVHFHESDGSYVTHVNHPEWVTWGTTHWHPGVSKDRLGKTDFSKINDTHGWGAKDWQHFSSNLLYTITLLTHSYMLLDEVNNEAEVLLAGHTTPDDYPGWSTNNINVPRGFGRPQRAMMQQHLLTNRTDVIDKSVKRLQQNVLSDPKTKWIGGRVNGPVKVWAIGADNRLLGSNTLAWTAWNEILGWQGMVALYHITGHPEAKRMVIEWGTALLKYGWRVKRDVSGISELLIGHGIKWLDDGEPLTPEQQFDPKCFKPGGGIKLWGLPLVAYISKSELFPDDMRQLASEYYERLMFERRHGLGSKPGQVFDEFGKWDAI